MGIFTFGVAEPIWFYRSNNIVAKIPFANDDQRAQMAMLLSYYQNGLHGWIPYLVIGTLLGVVCYRQGRPMAMRYAFHPILGDSINGLLGDVIDAVTVSCTTFGVCTSLGLGVGAIGTAMQRLNSGIVADSQTTQLLIIWVITATATVSVLVGLHAGIKNLSKAAFYSGVALMAGLVCVDSPALLLNSYVQTLGHYVQWLITLSWDCDTWPSFTGQLTDEGRWKRVFMGFTKSTDTVAMSDFDATRLGTEALMNGAWGERTPYNFMNYWTVFYWAWWLAWAPFVGTFVARISRGRTVGEVIKGGLLAPIAFMFINRNILGTLGIRMQRVAEYALGNGVDIDWRTGSIDCAALGYENNQPTSAAAVKLAEQGYYALSCRARADQILDIMEPYGALTKWFQFLVVVSVILYFTTSSDSGSFVDDLIAAQGFENPPPLQKIYWACTEGALAHTLVTRGGIKVIQGAAIVSTFPTTIATCFLCVSLLRVLKYETGDERIHTSRSSFDTRMFDFIDGFANEHPKSRGDRALSVLRAFVFPFPAIFSAWTEIGDKDIDAKTKGIIATVTHWTWIVLFSLTSVVDGANTMGWLIYIGYTAFIATTRKHLRDERRVYGNIVEDFFASFTMYPFALSQMELEASVHEIKMA